jgi:murein DD-endopeptidase MepM/ murein hydrolase activator NlpD
MAKRKRITLLIIPEEGGKTFEFKVPRVLVGFFMFLLLAMVAFLGLGLRAQLQADNRSAQVERLEREKVLLEEEVAQIKELERVLRRLQDSNRRLYTILRESLGLEPETEVLLTSNSGEVYISAVERMRWGRTSTLPSMWPARGVMTRRFGPDFPGVELSLPLGSLVRAGGAGQVVETRYDERFGHLLVIDHGNGIASHYGYNASLLVERSDYVQQGQPIALTGHSGKAPGPALFYAVYEVGQARDPLYYRLWL